MKPKRLGTARKKGRAKGVDHATEGTQTKVASQGEGECPSTAKSPTEGRKNGKGKSHAARELLEQAAELPTESHRLAQLTKMAEKTVN